jgi:putative ABC transport system permease protein
MNTIRYLFRLVSLHHLRHHPLRTLLALLGMILGSAMLFTGLAGLPASESAFSGGVSILTGRAQLDVRGDKLESGLLTAIRQTEGVSAAAPVVTGGSLILGQNELVVVWGIDPAVERQVRDYNVSRGNFLAARGEILLSAAYATEKGFAPGQSINLIGTGGLYKFTLVGTLQSGGVTDLNGGDVVMLHYEDALALQGTNRLSYVSILAKADLNGVTTRLRAALPDSLKVNTPDMGNQKPASWFVARMLSLFTAMLPALLGVMFIFEALTASVTQRRYEIGLLRALGVTRGGIRWLFLAEAGILGVIGSIPGELLGNAIMRATSERTTVNGLSYQIAIDVPVWVPILAFLMGTGFAMLAGLRPASRAALVDPIEAMARPRMDTGTMRFGAVRIIIGIGILGLGYLARRAFDNTTMASSMPILSVLLVAASLILLFPPLLVTLGRLLTGPMHRIFGTGGLLAAESFAKRPRRLVATGIMVVLVTWLFALGSGADQGISRYLDEYVTGEYPADLVMAGAGMSPLAPLASIPADVVTEVTARPAVAQVARERTISLPHNSHTYTVRALDVAAFRSMGGRIPWEFGDESTAYARLQNTEKPALLASGYDALTDGLLRPGALVKLDTPGGPVEFEVVGTVFSPTGTATSTGLLILDWSLYRRLWKDEQVSRLLLKLAPGADIQAERRDLLRRYALRGVVVADQATIRAVAGNTIMTFSAILLLLLPFMMLGIANTLFIAVLDRRREVGVLRAVGTLRRHITASVILEALILLGMACLFAVPIAFYNIDLMLFDRIVGVRIMPDLLGIMQTITCILIAGALAAYLPARRAGHTDILEALRYE